jgi:hypothetical protein
MKRIVFIDITIGKEGKKNKEVKIDGISERISSGEFRLEQADGKFDSFYKVAPLC